MVSNLFAIMLRVGLIGVGRHGERYARHLVQDSLGARLVALARRNEAALRRQTEEFGCKGYLDYRELLASADVDAVVVVVPPTVHLDIIRAAVEAGKPVLLEKPAAPNLDVGLQMLQLVRRSGLPVMVAQTLRFNGVVRVLRDARREIGPVHALRIGQRFEPSRPGWIDDPAVSGGGMILHTGVHCFDLVRWLAESEVVAVSCAHSRVRAQRTEDNFACTLRLRDNHALASVAGSRATASRSGGVELAGEHGQLIGDHILNQAWLVRGTVASLLSVPEPVPTVRETLRSFIQALRTRDSLPIPLEDGLKAVAIADACYRSAASGREELVAAVD